MTQRSAEHIAYYLPRLDGVLTTDWERGFVKSVRRQSFRPGWQPSAKQAPILNGFIDRLFEDEDDALVVDPDAALPPS